MFSVIDCLLSVVGLVSCSEAVSLLFSFFTFNALFLFTVNPSPDSSGYPFAPAFGVKDRSA
jgi:hypothetical protein